MTDALRLSTLADHAILDTLPEPGFDALALAAAQGLRARHAVVSFLDGSRQWYKARFGMEVRSVDLASSFCTHAIRGDAVMVVPDARRDERFASNPMVIGPPHVRFYAGAPIRARNRMRIGTVCVFDPHPRPDISERERQLLVSLAARTVELLEARRIAPPCAAERGQPSLRARSS